MHAAFSIQELRKRLRTAPLEARQRCSFLLIRHGLSAVGPQRTVKTTIEAEVPATKSNAAVRDFQ